MRLNFTTFRKSLFVLSAVAVLTSGCGNDAAKDGDELPEVDSTQTTIVNINGEIFSIPSPIQTAFLIKSSGANYTKEILNSPSKSSQYTTNFSKALNLGIYGADLGYVTMYDQTQDAIGLMNAAKKIAGELNITGAFDNATLERFQKNLGNKDSMLVLTSVAYRTVDSYLKNNDRNDISGLVLAGGWIESLYFATNVYKVKKDEFIKVRIAEQKSSLQSLIKLLTQFYSQPEYTEFVDALNDLSTVFDGVTFKYIYEKPTTDADKKMTTINSKSEVTISDEQIESISQKIKTIRTGIVR
ncbi:MAG TPA: hypothetical protein VLB84_21220 [Bacteroidia bacterium]|nr:hypothetical protein [Bacteroidia bacterium]